MGVGHIEKAGKREKEETKIHSEEDEKDWKKGGRRQELFSQFLRG